MAQRRLAAAALLAAASLLAAAAAVSAAPAPDASASSSHKPLLPLDGSDIGLFVVAFLALGLASGAGVGGGERGPAPAAGRWELMNVKATGRVDICIRPCT